MILWHGELNMIKEGMIIEGHFWREPVEIKKVEVVRFLVPVKEWKGKGIRSSGY